MDVEQQTLSSLRRALTETISQREHLQIIADECVADIQRRTTFLHAAIDEIDRTFTRRVLVLQAKELDGLAKHEEQLNRAIIELTSRIESKTQELLLSIPESADIPHYRNPVGLSDDEYTLIQNLSDFERICLNFKSSSVSQDDLSAMFGSIEYYHITVPSPISNEPPLPDETPKFAVEQVANFTCKEKSPNIHALLPISATEAWVCSGWGSKDIHLYDIDGCTKVSLTLDDGVDHMVMTSCGDLLVSCYNGTAIMRVDEDLQTTRFATLNFSPRGMTVSSSKVIYVCGVERITGKSELNRHLIVKMSESGDVLSQVEVSPHDPHRIAVDSHGNMFFSDYNSSRREFVVMDATGNVKVIYNTSSETPLYNPFYPLGVARDRYGHVLISDWNNDCVHLLDKDGQFVRYLLTSGDGIECPSALGIDREHRLWVGNGVGTVRIYKYVI